MVNSTRHAGAPSLRAPASARSEGAADPQHERRRAWLWLVLALSTAGLWQLCFAPFDMAALAYLVLVPWGLVVILPRRGRTAMAWGWATGLVAMAAGLYWLTWITLLGYALLSLYISFYWLAAAWIVRRAAAQNRPLWLVLPIAWTALEYIRGTFASGFPWFSLAHSQYRWTMLIQIADATGPWGVSFFVAMVNGLILDLILRRQRWLGGRWWRLPARLIRSAPAGWAATALAATGLLGYGALRLWQAPRFTSPGPRIGVVQGAFPISLFHPEAGEKVIFQEYLKLTQQLPLKELDLVVWPESMLPGVILDEENFVPLPIYQRKAAEVPELADLLAWRQRAREQLAEVLLNAKVPLLAGAGTIRENPDPQAEPWFGQFNSSVLIEARPRGQLVVKGLYDKMHCVPVSEYMPFGQGWPWLHRTLRRLVPPSMPQLTPGRQLRRFDIGKPGRTWRLATPICYEGVFAHVCRRLTYGGSAGAPADILVNMSNDGWFIAQLPDRQLASSELDQHLAGYVFRAIENRRSVVRAVNTGISGFVDSSGRIQRVVRHEQTGQRKMITGTAEMQVLVDRRRSLYSLIGDIPAQVTAAALAGTVLVLWRRGGRAPGRSKP